MASRRTIRPALAVVPLALLVGCGGGGGTSQLSRADEIARGLDEAIEATSAAGRASDDQADSAAKNTICQGLSVYSSEPASITAEGLQAYAEQQQLEASLSLQGVDPEAAQRLASAAQAISDTQEAAEVAGELGC